MLIHVNWQTYNSYHFRINYKINSSTTTCIQGEVSVEITLLVATKTSVGLPNLNPPPQFVGLPWLL